MPWTFEKSRMTRIENYKKSVGKYRVFFNFHKNTLILVLYFTQNYEMEETSLILLIEHCLLNKTTISQKTCRKLVINSFPNHRSNVEGKLIFKAFPINSSGTAKWKITKKIEKLSLKIKKAPIFSHRLNFLIYNFHMNYLIEFSIFFFADLVWIRFRQ
jgi:hypothetical protein